MPIKFFFSCFLNLRLTHFSSNTYRFKTNGYIIQGFIIVEEIEPNQQTQNQCRIPSLQSGYIIDILQKINCTMVQAFQNYRMAELIPARVPESANLLAKAFLRNNKIWKTFNKDQEIVQKFMASKIYQALQWQEQLRKDGVIGKTTFLSFIYLDLNDKILAVIVNVDLVQYLTKKSQYQLKQMDSLSKCNDQLFKSIDSRDKVPGLCLRSLFVAIDQKSMGMGILLPFSIAFSRYLHEHGFRKIYSRPTSKAVETFLVKKGADVVSKISINEKGIKQDISLLKTYFQPLKYDYSLSALSTFNAKL